MKELIEIQKICAEIEWMFNDMKAEIEKNNPENVAALCNRIDAQMMKLKLAYNYTHYKEVEFNQVTDDFLGPWDILLDEQIKKLK